MQLSSDLLPSNASHFPLKYQDITLPAPHSFPVSHLSPNLPFTSSISLPTGCKAVLRMGSIANNKNDGPNIAVTDNGNYIVDLFFTAPIADVALAAKEIKATVGECARHLDCL
jgi:Ribose 5-phosphate isomerase A (phosphoriboisomerase A)